MYKLKRHTHTSTSIYSFIHLHESDVSDLISFESIYEKKIYDFLQYLNKKFDKTDIALCVRSNNEYKTEEPNKREEKLVHKTCASHGN